MGAMLYAAVYGLLNTTGFVIAVKLLSVALAVVFCLYFSPRRAGTNGAAPLSARPAFLRP